MKPSSLESVFEAFAQWRHDQVRVVSTLVDLLAQHELDEEAVLQRLQGIRHRLLNPTLSVAFVAEFSRGKSELINAIFFSHMGQRIMPSAAGRTTMCPTEMGFDAPLAQGLYLLPIGTRSERRSLMHWRTHLHEWEFIAVDALDAPRLAQHMQQVTELQPVSVAQAKALALFNDKAPLLQDDGKVLIPKWRHAVLNLDLPLLRQGLVVIDTPGLNAVGVEPELTLGLLSQVDALVFILAADLGVSQSDLDMWTQHLMPTQAGDHNRLAVLNKIDILWDGLTSLADIDAQLTRQRERVASYLHLQHDQVALVSAQKGLLARIKHDPSLLELSQLEAFEKRLAHEVVKRHQQSLAEQVQTGVSQSLQSTRQQLAARTELLAQQHTELLTMRGSNHDMVRHMRLRVLAELDLFEQGCQQAQALKRVHERLVAQVLARLSPDTLAHAMADLQAELARTGMKWAGLKAYKAWCERLRTDVAQAQQQIDEAYEGLSRMSERLRDKLGFGLEAQRAADLAPTLYALTAIDNDLAASFAMSQWWAMRRPGEAQRWLDALEHRVQAVLLAAREHVQQWNAQLLAPLAGQTVEREKHFERRMQVVRRIEDAAGGVDERLAEVQLQRDTAQEAAQAMDQFERGL